MSRRSRAGKPHKRAWRRAKGQKNQCCYCRESFSNRNPPTFDHIVPLSVDHLSSRTVVACVLCNNARGNADYETYSAAVEAEHVAARAEHRRYRRPRLYAHGEISTETRRERMERANG